MATKDSILKKRLIKEGIIYVVALIAFVAGGMLLANYNDDAQSEKQNRNNENAAMRAEHDAIDQQLGTGFESSAFYGVYIKNHSDDLQLRREIATQWMSALHERNHLTGLNVTISPITDMNPEFAPIKSGILVKSDVRLTFAGVTDNSVYGFLSDLERKMPGMMVVQDIKLSRTGDPSRDVVMNLSQHHITPLVSGDVSFTWLGIRPSDNVKTEVPSPLDRFKHGAR